MTEFEGILNKVAAGFPVQAGIGDGTSSSDLPSPLSGHCPYADLDAPWLGYLASAVIVIMAVVLPAVHYAKHDDIHFCNRAVEEEVNAFNDMKSNVAELP